MAQCRHCGRTTESSHRFCPWCATPLRSKLVEFFIGADDDSRKALRVSRYLPERRVRFSVWDDTGTVKAAVSLDEDEAARLAAFVAPRPPRSRLLEELRTLVRR
jgi:RNA polymerase subunit RPABC4/transcription elongation factor Spt4